MPPVREHFREMLTAARSQAKIPHSSLQTSKVLGGLSLEVGAEPP